MEFRTIALVLALALYGLIGLAIWSMWMDEKENRKDGG